MSGAVLTLGTRGSRLALWQAEWVAAQLLRHGVRTRITVIRTRGDVQTEVPLGQLGADTVGFFTKEIEESLLRGDIDVAVHSLKDLPTQCPAGLTLAAILPREEARDCLVVRRAAYQPQAAATGLVLAPGARVGTSALRRQAQLRAVRPDVQVVDCRGNVGTRLARLRAPDGPLDALVLAYAGLRRLEFAADDVICVPLEPELFVPAPGQGALALEARCGAEAVLEALLCLHDAATARQVEAERALLARLQGGCHLPFGAYATREAGALRLKAFLGPCGQAPGRGPQWVDATGQQPQEVALRAWQRLVGA